MPIRSSIYLIVMLLMMQKIAYTQKLLDFKSFDTNTYIYKLNPEQTIFVTSKGSIADTNFLFNRIWKTMPRQSYTAESLPFGNYIIAQIDRDVVRYQLVYRHTFTCKAIVIGDKIILFIQDIKTKAILEDALVHIQSNVLTFDKGVGGYVIQKHIFQKIKHSDAWVQIQTKSDFAVFHMQFNKGNPSPSVSVNPYAEGRSEGYIISDKPVYRPLDTLRLKAFLTDPHRGRPIRKKSILSISEPQQNFLFTKKIKPSSPGAYVFNWVIPDSLLIDRPLYIAFQYRKKNFQLSKQSKVYLEDYRLKESVYDVQMPVSEFYAGDDIRCQISALDANGFPLQGTMLHYKLSIVNVFDFYGDSLMLSAKRKSNCLEGDTLYPYSNSMEFIIPSKSLPSMHAQYNLEVSFTDPNTFERKVISRSFTKQSEQEKILCYQQEDSLWLRCLYNRKDTTRAFRIICISNQDTLSDQHIYTPYHLKLSPYCSRVIYIDKDSVSKQLDISFNPLQIMHLKNKQGKDSLQIDFHFPFTEAVYYEVLKNNKSILSGKDTALHLRLADNGRNVYILRFTHNIHGQIERNFYEITYVPQTHHIQIKSDLPAQSFPGQQYPVHVRVSDTRNKALKKINIAAYAVNKQFEDRLVSPQIIIPESYKDLISIEPTRFTDQCHLSQPSLANQYTIRPKHLNTFDLRKNEYYALRYPEKTYAFISRNIQSTQPEMSVILTVKNQTYKPKYILVDGIPVYISDLQSDPYSFPIIPGKHRISFRYFDKLIEVNNLKFERNKKYYLGMNMDGELAPHINVRMIDSLTVAQPNEEEQNLLYNSLVLTNPFMADTIYLLPNAETNDRFTYNRQQPPQQLQIDGERYYAFGPVSNAQKVSIKIGNKLFQLEKGTTWKHYYDVNSKEFISKNQGALKGAFLAFSERPFTDADLSALRNPDTLKPLIPTVPVSYHSQAQQLQLKPEEVEFSQRYGGGQSGGQSQIILKNNHPQQYVKAIWVINRSKPDEAHFISNISRDPLSRNYTNGAGQVDIYFLMNANKMFVIRHHQLQQQDEMYVNPALWEQESIHMHKLAIPIQIYDDLTQLPMQPFYLHPEELKADLHVTTRKDNNFPLLHGTLTNKSHTPVTSAFIILEMNGQYKYGATTNDRGVFEFLDLPSGTYQIKVYHPEYELRNYEAVLLQRGNEYDLKSQLKERGHQQPIYESIQNDFRMMVFGNAYQTNKLKCTVYDYASRLNLQGATFRLREGTKIRFETIMKEKHQIEIPIPIMEEIAYSLEVSREGYTPFVLEDFHFKQEMLTSLDIFLRPVNPQIPVPLKSFKLDHLHWVNAEPILPEDKRVGYSDKKNNDQYNIKGQVRDQEGKAIAGAQIYLADESHFVFINIQTDKEGRFQITGLKDGIYDMKITANMFQMQIIRNLNVNAFQGIDINCQLQLNELSGTMVVESSVRNRSENRYIEESYTPSNIGTNYIEKNSYQSSPTYLGSATMQNIATSDLSYSWTTEGITVYEPVEIKSPKANYASDDMLKTMEGHSKSHPIRSRFDDHGFWVPNLISDRKGWVHFNIRLPDNLTTWKTWIIAMGKKRMHGIDSGEIKVYKPLQTQSILPGFVYLYDQVWAKAKFSNLTDSEKIIQTTIKINDQVKSTKKLTVLHHSSDSVMLDVQTMDTIHWLAGLKYLETYRDEELRNIEVIPSSLRHYLNQHFVMERDSTYALHLPENTQGKIIFNNNLLEKILHEIEELDQYEYFGTEHSASKLKGLLLKEQILRSLGEAKNLKSSIAALLNRIADYQQADGTWGWWKGEQGQWRMTLYVLEVLQLAQDYGHYHPCIEQAVSAFKLNYNSMNTSNQLYGFYLLQKRGQLSSSMQTMFQRIDAKLISSTDKLYYLKIKDMTGLPVKPQELYHVLLALKEELPKPYTADFFFDPRADIFTAYRLFGNSPLGDEWLTLFKSQLLSGNLEKQLNTYSKAAMIEALTRSALQKGEKPIQAEIKVNDTLRIKSFPYHLPIKGQQYTFQHTGGDIFVQTAEEIRVQQPNMKDSLFRIQTTFEQANHISDQLVGGTPCQLKVTLDAYRSFDYCVLEIPIPSGMYVIEKPQFTFGHIQYYRHKIVLFFSRIEMGQQAFQFQLMPFLKGNFELPAAQCALMYYPFLSGNNTNRKITIR